MTIKNLIGANWIIQVTEVPNKSAHSPDDMGELRANGSPGDLVWFIKEGKMLAVATFIAATPDEVSYNKFYDISDCELHPAIPTLHTTTTSYYEQTTWAWGAYVEYVYICRYRKITE
jgi:hypothetical protein